MEKLEIVYNEYVRLVEPHGKVLDSSFDDIRLFGVVGSAIGILGGLKESGIESLSTVKDELYFVIILVLFFLIAIIAFRDLLKQVYIIHLSLNIKKMEDYLRENYFEEGKLFQLRESWLEKYYPLIKKSYSAFLIIFFIPLIVLPVYLFWGEESRIYGIITCATMIIILTIYSVLIGHIYETGKKNESSNYQ